MSSNQDFCDSFKTLTGHAPMRWQQRLYAEHFAAGNALPSAVSVPTGLGKTAVMAVWLVALAEQLDGNRDGKANPPLPRHLVYVVDRRAVVDQATRFAEDLRKNLAEKPEAEKLREALGLADSALPISTLRGQFVDNREWLEDPSKPAIIVGTVDMIGSRLLFEGYGVSRKMRPYHAGLLGADTLVLLDEAHLVPPFEALLSSIANGAAVYGARSGDDRQHVPAFKLLPLSATGRGQTAQPFTLEERDFLNPDDKTIIDTVAHERLHAQKRLKLHELGDKKLEEGLTEQAWGLAQDGEGGLKPVRVIIYCNSREVAGKVKAELDKKAKGTVAAGNTELFVGARRVRERIDAECRLKDLGFLAGKETKQPQPAFLVATSAGEVGVDLDADHMVCDLVAWERMVQRFGRVNRRGGQDRQAEIIVLVESQPKPPELKADADDKARKKHESDLEKHHREIEGLQRTKRPFGEALTAAEDGRFDVSPEALRKLAQQSRSDDGVAKIIQAASSPAPLRPALNRALVDAWSMTSLPEHTGRPEVAPWLRGWVDEEPQTTVVWRTHLPVRDQPPVSKNEIEDYFEAAPLHVSEALETESWRIFDWLKKRADKLHKIPDADKILKAGDVVAMLLTADGSLVRILELGHLLGDNKSKDSKRRLENIENDIKGQTLVMDARFGGMTDGLLNPDSDKAQPTTDEGREWLPPADGKPVVRFRVLLVAPREESDENAEKDWHESLRFDLQRNPDGEAMRWLSVQKWRDTSNNENDRAAGRPQALAEHHSCAADKAKRIGQRLRLPEDYVCALRIAARLHDEGKRAQRWQRAFRAERDAKKLGITGPLAKTRGPINQAVLGGYRHEFGSLPYAQDDAEFKKLSPKMQDLVLHLIAAHHGYARPLIATAGCEDAPPSALEERAQHVALRFARLQKRWGPWGLAWWEALLRAADAQASRANDEREDT